MGRLAGVEPASFQLPFNPVRSGEGYRRIYKWCRSSESNGVLSLFRRACATRASLERHVVTNRSWSPPYSVHYRLHVANYSTFTYGLLLVVSSLGFIGLTTPTLPCSRLGPDSMTVGINGCGGWTRTISPFRTPGYEPGHQLLVFPAIKIC